jgi:hypothetical protein
VCWQIGLSRCLGGAGRVGLLTAEIRASMGEVVTPFGG